MKFVDYAKIHLRSGSGGNGCASFRREKFIPYGGPDGGDGGSGGGIIFQGVKGKTTLLDFQFRQHFHASNGTRGMGKDKHGKSGEPLVLQVPLGTVVQDAETGEVLHEVVDEQPRLCLAGGAGGRGNTRFKTSTNRAPEMAEVGQPGIEKWIVLELKLMADVGLVGFPNAGKSTLISRISKARPKIADYPFTTLTPNLGMVQTEGFESFVVADIPGIIQGAHEGVGLGLRFLRHIERTALLLLLVDVSDTIEHDPMEEYRILLRELEAFQATLLDKPRAVALTKVDALSDAGRLEDLAAQLQGEGEQVYPISSVTGSGIPELVNYLGAQVLKQRAELASQDEHASASTPHKTPPHGRPAGSGISSERNR
ncbi:MAG: GTPase ObgE [SAR324 cluster bacterium]|nr:GTPase ObgE [SAR324 cluster bacterium]